MRVCDGEANHVVARAVQLEEKESEVTTKMGYLSARMVKADTVLQHSYNFLSVRRRKKPKIGKTVTELVTSNRFQVRGITTENVVVFKAGTNNVIQGQVRGDLR